MSIITISIEREELSDHTGVTSIVFDASGHPLDEYLPGLCVDIDNGRVHIRWGKVYGDYFVNWRPPFAPIAFEYDGRAYKFCLEGCETHPSYTGEITG